MRIFFPHAQYITYQPLKVLKESRLTKEDANTKIVPSYPHSELFEYHFVAFMFFNADSELIKGKFWLNVFFNQLKTIFNFRHPKTRLIGELFEQHFTVDSTVVG